MNLARAGIEVLCPRIREERVVRRRFQSVINPLFPGYIFARFSLQQSRLVMYTSGVRNLVSFGSAPAVVSKDVIDGILDRLNERVVNFRHPIFSRGDVVCINDGPLAGLEAVFEREMNGQQRAMLLIKALASQVRVIVDLNSVANR